MTRRIGVILAALAALALVSGLRVASAHECGYDPANPDECRPTRVWPNWRGDRIPIFGLDNRDDPEQRREAQRWRDEWGCRQQFCIWADFSNSVNSGTPNEAHAGTAGDHSFLGEAAHQSEGHGTNEGNHDSHGGSTYADVCIAESHDTSYAGQAGECDEGLEDNQVGLTILDHNPCPLCEDNYVLVRPLDTDCDDAGEASHRQYCNQRMLTNSADTIAYDADHPGEYTCGYREPGGDPDNQLCPAVVYSFDGQGTVGAKPHAPSARQQLT